MKIKPSESYQLRGSPKLSSSLAAYHLRKPLDLAVKQPVLAKNQSNSDLVREYFPSPAAQPDSSLESSHTTRMRFRPDSRPQPAKSASLSNRTTEKQQLGSACLPDSLKEQGNMWKLRHGFESIKQSEMVELYRIIQYYEGKTKQLEQQAQRYEEALAAIGRDCDQKSRHKTEVELLVSLYERLRKDNEELSAELAQRQLKIRLLQDKQHKLQMKLKFLDSKNYYRQKMRLSNPKGQSKSKSQASLSNRQYLLNAIDFKRKQQKYGNLQSKINMIEVNLLSFKKQIESLQAEINVKDKIIQDLQQKLELSKAASLDCQLAQVIKRHSTQSNNLQLKRNPQEPAFFKEQQRKEVKAVQRNKSQSHVFADEPPALMKLKYQLMCHEISHEMLTQMLATRQLGLEELQGQPYNLNKQQASVIVDLVSQFGNGALGKGNELHESLKRVIPTYTNISLRKQKQLKTQVLNELTNRQTEFEQLIQKRESIKCSELEKILTDWGLSQTHIDVLLKACFQVEPSIQHLKTQRFKRIIEQWSSK